MTDEKYIKNQKSFIKRERKSILQDHWQASSVLLFIIAVVIVINAGFAPPNQWKDTTITLQSYHTVPTSKGGSRLDIYDTSGNRYTVNRKESAIKKHLVTGKQYAFTYSDNFFHDIVEVIQIDGTEFLDYDSALKNYRVTKIILWVISGILFVWLVLINLFYYKCISTDRKKRIQKYKKRINGKKQ